MKVGSSQATTSPGRRIARVARLRAWVAPLVTMMSCGSSATLRSAESAAIAAASSGTPWTSVYWIARSGSDAITAAVAARIASIGKILADG